MNKPKRTKRPRKEDSEAIADYAWANITCPGCGAEPKSACVPLPEPPRTVCKERFIAAAMAMKNARKARNPSREAAEANARLDLATERGGFMHEVPDADVAERMREALPPPVTLTRGDIVRIVSETKPERMMRVVHIEPHVILLGEPGAEDEPMTFNQDTVIRVLGANSSKEQQR